MAAAAEARDKMAVADRTGDADEAAVVAANLGVNTLSDAQKTAPRHERNRRLLPHQLQPPVALIRVQEAIHRRSGVDVVVAADLLAKALRLPRSRNNLFAKVITGERSAGSRS